jgi:hypothetical protein
VDPQALKRAGEDELREVLGSPSLRGEELKSAIAKLGVRRGIDPFRACLWLLARIDRPEEEAGAIFDAVELQRALLQERLGRDPGLAVAALDSVLSPDGALRRATQRHAPRAEFGMAADGEAPETPPLEELLGSEVRRAARFREPLALLVLAPERGGDDDSLMSRAAAILGQALRDTDHVARILPAGYVAILPSTPGAGALDAAGRMRESLFAATGVFWSAGMAAAPDLPWEAEALARGAQEALRAARLAGGPHVVSCRPERRAHPRRLAGDLVAAVLREDGLDQEMTLADLSVGGALLGTAERLAPGSEVLLALRETSARPREARVVSRVVRVDRNPPDSGSAPWKTAVCFLAGSENRLKVAGLLADLPVSPSRGLERS